MSDVVIRAEGLGKHYMIGHEAERERYVALRDTLSRGVKNIWRKTADMARGRAIVAGDSTEEFWALKDVNFEVKRGEVLGVIGRNGAGKSTLLKILSRITEPSEGRVTIKGRVASLLEVGTGFHPELTGRENIYLNGAILGMTRAEIRRKFDEIVAFAEIEKFLDTPVKRYSSGMYVRLAFAVAAHLEPEILLVDEVLAVGDAEFQKKCLGKMKDVAGHGRTVLFVSHNLAAVETICPRTLRLADGKLVDDGRSEDVIASYFQQRREISRGNLSQSRALQDGLMIESLHLSATTIRSGDPLEARFEFQAGKPGLIYECAMLLKSVKGIRLGIVDLRENSTVPLRFQPGRFDISVRIPSLPLVEGDVAIGLFLVTKEYRGEVVDLGELTIVAPRSSKGFAGYPAEHRGLLVLEAEASVTLGETAAAE